MNNTYNVDMSAKNIMKFGNVAEETKTLEEKIPLRTASDSVRALLAAKILQKRRHTLHELSNPMSQESFQHYVQFHSLNTSTIKRTQGSSNIPGCSQNTQTVPKVSHDLHPKQFRSSSLAGLKQFDELLWVDHIFSSITASPPNQSFSSDEQLENYQAFQVKNAEMASVPKLLHTGNVSLESLRYPSLPNVIHDSEQEMIATSSLNQMFGDIDVDNSESRDVNAGCHGNVIKSHFENNPELDLFSGFDFETLYK